MPDLESVGKTTYRFLPASKEYEVREPGKPPAYIHFHPEHGSLTAEGFGKEAPDEIVAYGEESPLPDKELQPICRTSGNRIVAVHVFPKTPDPKIWPYPGTYFPETGPEDIRKIMRQMTWKINDQALKSNGGGAGRKLAVDCDASGNIAVHELATEGDGINESYVPEVLKDGKVFAEGTPTGTEAVKYLLFLNYNGGSGGCQAPLVKIDRKTSNPIATTTSYAIAQYEVGGGCTLHELFHALGAVQPTAPFATAGGHCYDGADVMCYDDTFGENPAYQNLGGCPGLTEEPLDCNYDSYFNAWPAPSNWLATHWNIAGPENPFVVEVPTANAPTAAVSEIANVKETEAELVGSLNAHGSATTYHFEYVKDATYQLDQPNGFKRATSTPATSGGSGSLNVSVKETIKNLSASTTYHVRIVAASAQGTSFGQDVTFTTKSPPVVPPPGVTTGAASVAGTTATLSGLVDTHGTGHRYLAAFEYSTTAGSGTGEKGGTVLINWDSAELPEYPHYFSTQDPVAVSGVVEGLEPERKYYYRIGAADLDPPYAVVWGEEKMFETEYSAPIIKNVSADPAEATETTLRATVNPVGLNTTYHFEYLSEPEFQAKGWAGATSVPSSPKGIGAGTQGVKVSEPVSGLKSSTTYRFRVVAVNSIGTTAVDGGTFTTLGSWSLQSTSNPPPPPTETRFENVSCASSTSCMAVGHNAERGSGYVAAWNGTQWEGKTGGNIQGKNGEYGVSCIATTCRTVGWGSGLYSGGLVSDVWTESGGKWSRTALQSLPKPEGATDVKLRDISCSSASACTAVGSYVKEGKTKTLAKRWNGSSWSIQTTPNPEAGDAQLLGVSCEAVNSCTAVGKQGTSSYAMRWNGSSWTATSTPSPAGAVESDLQKVSCTSASFCMAAGSFKESGKNKKTLALKWNGSAWSVATTPNPATNYGASLLGISCASSTSCSAVGRYVSAATIPSELWATEEKTLALSWNGSQWSIQSSPNPEGKKFSLLNDVSCSAAAACTAVGSAAPAKNGEMVTLGERWNGSSWSLQSTSNPPPPPTAARFENVSCASSTSCLAVGHNAVQGKGYVAAWNGTQWESKGGNIQGKNGEYGVSCIATTCRTVGRVGGTLWSDVWTESGGKWSYTTYQMLFPPEGGSEAKLHDISCTSSSACTAVGSYVKEGKTKTLAQRWNGSSWSIQTTPNPEAGNAELIGVSCDSASSCTAVGKQGLASYAMRWNGSSWTATSIPSPAGAVESDLQKVSCTSASFCMAAGSFDESGNKKTLALQWNGSAWSLATTPNPATNYGATLRGVSCASATSCTAVGRYVSASPVEAEFWVSEEKTLAMSWNGSQWSIRFSPNPEGKKFSDLNGVSCSATAVCTAVGGAMPAGKGEMVTLGERYQ